MIKELYQLLSFIDLSYFNLTCALHDDFMIALRKQNYHLYLNKFVGSEKNLFFVKLYECLLGGGVLGNSLGALRDCVLGQLTREEEPDSSLDFPGGDG